MIENIAAKAMAHLEGVIQKVTKPYVGVIDRPRNNAAADVAKKFKKVKGVQQVLPEGGTGVDYTVFAPDTTSRTKTTAPVMKFGLEDKARFVEVTGARQEAKAVKVCAELEAKAKAIADRKASSRIFSCEAEGCTAMYCREFYLRAHEDAGVHWYGKSNQLKYTMSRKDGEGNLVRTAPNQRVSPAIVRDMILTSAAAALVGVCGAGPGTRRHEGQLTATAGASPVAGAAITIDPIAAGYAMKAPAAKVCKKKKSKKFAFIVWVHGLGEKKVSGNGAVKVSPEQAEKVMRLVGTAEGAAKYPQEEYMAVTDGRKRFMLVELQDSYQLKGYLGKARADLVLMYDRALKKEQDEDAKRAESGLLAEEDVVYVDVDDDDEEFVPNDRLA